ncbi:MAG: glucosaminidase domain-containing protein [Paludibacter sp.]|nr:glucosaminidase domain-containing protein [Paludibacter sp.]
MNELKPCVKLTPKDFTRLLLPFAKETETKSGISAIAILAQAALESGWNRASIGWMFFGVKDNDGLNGNEQLLTTTEYSRRADLKFPVIISITPIIRNGQKWFKYRIKDYFRKYETPEQCFTDHANFFFKYSRYAAALNVKSDPYKFIDEIAKAGYATDPDYAENLKSIARMIEKNII